MSGEDGPTFLRHVKSWLLVFILFVAVVTAFGFGDILKIIKIEEFEESKDIIITISLSFNVFSLLLLVVTNTLFNKAKHMRVEINRDLMKDYRTGILITFLLSALVIASIIFTPYRHEYVAYAILCTLSVVIAMSIILALGLYQIATLLTQNNKELKVTNSDILST
ncbi:MAG: hypothetical protein QW456_05175 [Ignisphaera sp.]